MSKKVKLKAVCADFPNPYGKSDLFKKNLVLEQEILRLQKKQLFVQHFITIQEQSLMVCVDFHEIKGVTCIVDEWFDYEVTEYGDHINEELYVFEVQTDAKEFLVMLEFLGRDDDHRDVYHLHAPSMNQLQLELVKDAVFNQLETHKEIVITHQYNAI